MFIFFRKAEEGLSKIWNDETGGGGGTVSLVSNAVLMAYGMCYIYIQVIRDGSGATRDCRIISSSTISKVFIM